MYEQKNRAEKPEGCDADPRYLAFNDFDASGSVSADEVKVMLEAAKAAATNWPAQYDDFVGKMHEEVRRAGDAVKDLCELKEIFG